MGKQRDSNHLIIADNFAPHFLACNNYGFETVVSVLFSNTSTRLLYNERSEAECSIENFEFIVQ